MQIKPIIAAAGALAWLCLAPLVIAADTPAQPAEATAEDAPATMPDEESVRTMEPQTRTSRNTRPKVERHRDARACLEAGANTAIIKCANKYR